jgi:hypothetical protein
MVAANLTQSPLLFLRELCALRVKIYLQPGPAHSCHRAPKSRRICSSEKLGPNAFRMRSFKTQDLKPFRICSYKKTGQGEGHPLRIRRVPTYTPERPFTPSRGRGAAPFRAWIYFKVLCIAGGAGHSAQIGRVVTSLRSYFIASLVSNVFATDWPRCSPRRHYRWRRR